MHGTYVNAAIFSSLASWHDLEQRMDRWASMGALALAGLACVVFLFFK